VAEKTHRDLPIDRGWTFKLLNYRNFTSRFIL